MLWIVPVLCCILTVPNVSSMPKFPDVGLPTISDVTTVSGVPKIPDVAMFYSIPQVSGVPTVPNAPRAYGIRMVSSLPRVSVLNNAYFPEENPGLFEGDIEIRPVQNARGFAGRTSKLYRWPGGVVPYVIDTPFHEKLTIRRAMWTIASKTGNCIKFKPRTNETAYIKYQGGTGCHTPIGYNNDVSSVTLGPGCGRLGIIIHETMHALGFWHEQSRPDRNNYVTIKWNNILTGHRGNFEKYPSSMIDTLGTQYDYDSVMHYGAYAFAKGRKVTIAVKQAGAVIGQRTHLSTTDIRRIKLYYECHHRNFEKYPSSMIDILGTQYDYDSVMHYGAYEFAKDWKKVTIAVKKHGAVIGQRTHLSTTDIRRIKLYYQC